MILIRKKNRIKAVFTRRERAQRKLIPTYEGSKNICTARVEKEQEIVPRKK